MVLVKIITPDTQCFWYQVWSFFIIIYCETWYPMFLESGENNHTWYPMFLVSGATWWIMRPFKKNPSYWQHSALLYVCDWDYQLNSMSLRQYHLCCQHLSPWLYHESMSIPWFHVSTVSPCLYHDFMSLPWVSTISSRLYYESMSIPWIHLHTMRPCQ